MLMSIGRSWEGEQGGEQVGEREKGGKNRIQEERGNRATDAPSTPSMNASLTIGVSSTSVVICVMSARFLTRPHASPSGVSEGQSMPHCDGWSARGPETLRVFSN